MSSITKLRTFTGHNQKEREREKETDANVYNLVSSVFLLLTSNKPDWRKLSLPL